MTTQDKPKPWVDPISGERFSAIPTDQNGMLVQGFVHDPNHEFVAEDDFLDTPENH